MNLELLDVLKAKYGVTGLRRGGRVWRLCGRPGIFVAVASVILGSIRFAADPATQTVSASHSVL